MSSFAPWLILASLVFFAGHIMIAVAAFREGVGWGLAALFIPLASLFFVITHWEEGKTGFFVWLVGIPLFAFGMINAGKAASVDADGSAAVPVQQVPANLDINAAMNSARDAANAATDRQREMMREQMRNERGGDEPPPKPKTGFEAAVEEDRLEAERQQREAAHEQQQDYSSGE